VLLDELLELAETDGKVRKLLRQYGHEPVVVRVQPESVAETPEAADPLVITDAPELPRSITAEQATAELLKLARGARDAQGLVTSDVLAPGLVATELHIRPELAREAISAAGFVIDQETGKVRLAEDAQDVAKKVPEPAPEARTDPADRPVDPSLAATGPVDSAAAGEFDSGWARVSSSGRHEVWLNRATGQVQVRQAAV
jgi:hypothetical protein